ncbi:MAG: hypothetical protein ABSH15_04490 [Verrucomicrobiota bacterium]|jgi:hypothetical protein
MRYKRPNFQRKQQTSQELKDDLMGFLQRKFYEGHAVEFRKDYRRLLEWVVLWPAKWLIEKGVSLPDDRYREIFMTVFMDSLRFGNTDGIKYLPAWLAKVIQSHFAVHGDEIYESAKSIRTLAEHALLSAGKALQARPDPVRELAAAARLVKPAKAAKKPSQKEQLSLL